MSELVVIALILVFAGWVAAAATVRGGRSLPWMTGSLPWIWGAFSCVVVGVALASRIPPPLPQADDVPIEVTDDEYRTSSACRACHPDQYASWYGSYHRTMTQTATPESVMGTFDDVELEFAGATYRVFERDGELFGDMPAPDAQPGQANQRISVPIRQTTGSHHTQIYWYPAGRGRALASFPLVYLREQQRWLPRQWAFIGPPGPEHDSSGLWNRICIECHSTRASPRLGKGDFDSHVAEQGIACEACHGPGAEHQAANQSPLRRYGLHLNGDPDPTIVDPADLPHERSAQVCGQCHVAKTVFDREQFVDWRQNGSRFRPGDDLEETANIISTANLSRPSLQMLLRQQPDFYRSTFWADGVIRVAGREYSSLLETGCYTRGEMSCVSCHQMHKTPEDTRSQAQWADDQLAPGMRTDLACTQCHSGFEQDEEITAHTHHAPESSGSECQNCHMPYTTYGLLKAVRNHKVASPNVANELATGRPNACNQCHLDRSLGWAAIELQKAYGHEVPELTSDEAEVSAAIRWALEGDAAVRALAAWSMGWNQARETAGSDWLTPYLIELMNDPYDAIRIIARQSAQSLPDFSDTAYDELALPEHRADAIENMRQQWDARSQRTSLQVSSSNLERPSGKGRSTLFDARGKLDRGAVERLLERRDTRPIAILE